MAYKMIGSVLAVVVVATAAMIVLSTGDAQAFFPDCYYGCPGG